MNDTVQGEPLLAAATLGASVFDAGPTIQQVRKLVEEYYVPTTITVKDPLTGAEAPAELGRDGVSAIPATVFNDYLRGPRLRSGTASFTKIEGLIDHVNRFKDLGSALFAVDDRKAPSITAVLDYHNAGAGSAPRFGKHRSLFQFPLSDEWTAWVEKDGQAMDMKDFAEFLEDRIIDVLPLLDEDGIPEDLQKFISLCGGTVATPEKLIELSRGLHVHENSAVTQAINLSTGEGQISFQSEHVDSAGNQLKVPGLFLLAIPVFKGGMLYRIAARLRYRKAPGGLVFFYELWRTDRTFDHAFNEACERVQVETGLPLLFGKPE
ncbi:MAG TPA: DUF2303 family protein [Sphingobium sp.]|uniref:DUF2303 family protein n=1 Tax=Sphingobium sp. TaxID=1912891 RepID=UPI002ED059B6